MSRRVKERQAFPGQWMDEGTGSRVGSQEPGMTLRDYFAARAMAALLDFQVSRSICDNDPRYDPAGGGSFALAVATNAYEFADAMLAKRAKGGAR